MRRLLSRRGLVAAIFVAAAATCTADATNPGAADLMRAPAGLPDVWIGEAGAPTAIIEYLSMDCLHCLTFQQTVLPEIRKQVDAGRVRFTQRDLPLSQRAMDAAMLARCAGPRRGEMIEGLLIATRTWSYKETAAPLLNVAQSLGMARDAAEKCLANTSLADALMKARATALEQLKLQMVPTFFVNGEKYETTLPPGLLERLRTQPPR